MRGSGGGGGGLRRVACGSGGGSWGGPAPPPSPPLRAGERRYRRRIALSTATATAATAAPVRHASSVAGRRVLVVTHELSETGAPRACMELAHVLGAMGADVRLALQGDARPAAAEETCAFARLAAPLVRLRCSGLTRGALSGGVIVLSTAVLPNAHFIARFREKHAYSEASLVWWIHEGGSVMELLGEEALARALAVLAAPGLLDAVIFVSDFCRRFWVRAAAARGLTIAARTFILHWGIPDVKRDALGAAVLDDRGAAAVRASLGLCADDFVFLSLASFNPLKGHAGIVRALAQANARCPTPRRLRLVAAGVGIGSPGLFPAADVRWALAHPDFRFLRATANVGALLGAADAYVSNSQRGGETWGLSTLEAAAAGLAVLASGVGGTLEQLEHNVSALFHAVDTGDERAEESELAAHMCAVATDEALAARIAAGGQLRASVALGQAYLEGALEQLFDELR